jgi:hypothetical protein
MKQNVKGLIDFSIFDDAGKSNDIMIQLYWESNELHPSGSLEGLSLCHDLKNFGLISHSVWIEYN